jgi:hypothetical protein
VKRVVALALLLHGESGCGPSCPPSERVINDGIRHTAGAERVYQTSTADGPFIPFEGATLLHLRHGLGITPHHIAIYLSFSERPLQSGGGGFSQAAGNQATIQRVTADEVAIKNDSCANYYARVVIEAHEVTDAAADSD